MRILLGVSRCVPMCPGNNNNRYVWVNSDWCSVPRARGGGKKGGCNEMMSKDG